MSCMRQFFRSPNILLLPIYSPHPLALKRYGCGLVRLWGALTPIFYLGIVVLCRQTGPFLSKCYHILLRHSLYVKERGKWIYSILFFCQADSRKLAACEEHLGSDVDGPKPNKLLNWSWSPCPPRRARSWSCRPSPPWTTSPTTRWRCPTRTLRNSPGVCNQTHRKLFTPVKVNRFKVTQSYPQSVGKQKELNFRILPLTPGWRDSSTQTTWRLR